MIERPVITEIELKRPFTPNGGYAFTAEIPLDLSSSFAAGALGILLENDRALGPSEAVHLEIRERGMGRFSIWRPNIYFSSSDCTDCNENGRTYRLIAIDFSPAGKLYQHAHQRFAASDAELLALIKSNVTINNTLFLNFFGYYNGIKRALERHRIAFPQFAIELGTGARPYTALRFLIEGTSRFIANDIMQVARFFERDFIQDLRTLLDLVMPERSEMLDQIIIQRDSKQMSVRGLEIYDEQPFEVINVVEETCDLIFSTSVLEHVMKPREVVEKMVALLKPGGHAFHSIDLRDHRDFSRPLDFLRMTHEEYATINTENRLRSSDWLELFTATGFDLIECSYGAFKSASNKVHQYDFAPIKSPWVDEKMRNNFVVPFRRKELTDLSTLNITLLCRKPE